MLEKRIKCLLVEPYELPKEIEIDNTLEAKQKLVGGWIEQAFLPKDDSVVLICNEEGKINGMKPNRDIGHDIIFGPFLIVGNDFENGGYKSLTSEQILNYKIRFDKHSIVQTENRVLGILLNGRPHNFDREER